MTGTCQHHTHPSASASLHTHREKERRLQRGPRCCLRLCAEIEAAIAPSTICIRGKKKYLLCSSVDDPPTPTTSPPRSAFCRLLFSLLLLLREPLGSSSLVCARCQRDVQQSRERERKREKKKHTAKIRRALQLSDRKEKLKKTCEEKRQGKGINASAATRRVDSPNLKKKNRDSACFRCVAAYWHLICLPAQRSS